jgi:hypothetical protein
VHYEKQATYHRIPPLFLSKHEQKNTVLESCWFFMNSSKHSKCQAKTVIGTTYTDRYATGGQVQPSMAKISEKI